MATYNINLNIVLPSDADDESNTVHVKKMIDAHPLEDPITEVTVDVRDNFDENASTKTEVKSVTVAFNEEQAEDIRPVSVDFPNTGRSSMRFTKGNSDFTTHPTSSNHIYKYTFNKNAKHIPKESTGNGVPCNVKYKDKNGKSQRRNSNATIK